MKTIKVYFTRGVYDYLKMQKELELDIYTVSSDSRDGAYAIFHAPNGTTLEEVRNYDCVRKVMFIQDPVV